MAIAPVRVSPVFGATVKLTVPLPLPDGDDVSAIQLSSDAAVHEQSFEV